MSNTSSPLTDSIPESRATPAPRPATAFDRRDASSGPSVAPGSHDHKTTSSDRPVARPRVPDASDYHNERRRYLARARRNPGLRQQYLRNLIGYLLLRGAWSFGFFPVVLAFWIPLVLAEFNPVVMVQSLLPHLEAFVASNPEIQARTVNTLISGWVSIGLFFLLFDVIIHPFRSPFQQEADIHMRAWSQSQGLVPPDEM